MEKEYLDFFKNLIKENAAAVTQTTTQQSSATQYSAQSNPIQSKHFQKQK